MGFGGPENETKDRIECSSGHILEEKADGSFVRHSPFWAIARITVYDSKLEWAAQTVQVRWRSHKKHRQLANAGYRKRLEAQRRLREDKHKALMESGHITEAAVTASNRKRDYWKRVRQMQRWTAAKQMLIGMRKKMDMLLGRRRDTMDAMKNMAIAALSSGKTSSTVATEEELKALAFNQQGNDEYYSDDNVMLRVALMQSPVIHATVDTWFVVAQGMDTDDVVTKQQYMTMNVKLQLALVPDITIDEATESAEEDWKDDSKGAATMDQACFFSAIFQLVDLWVDSVDERDYCRFLVTLLRELTRKNNKMRSGLEWKPDKDIRLLDPAKLIEDTIDDIENDKKEFNKKKGKLGENVGFGSGIARF